MHSAADSMRTSKTFNFIYHLTIDVNDDESMRSNQLCLAFVMQLNADFSATFFSSLVFDGKIRTKELYFGLPFDASQTWMTMFS